SGKLLVLKEEGGQGIGLIDFRTIRGTSEEVAERFSECEKEIKLYGNGFVRDMLTSHIKMFENRSDLTPAQLAGHRKLIIGSWHNAKIVFGLGAH
ncbi:MAG TPA: hypothetical protein VMW36_07830, partial [Patescibacteria group bacterium]|nr:hypothetical protein [Patescibacteria group bacterium]